MKKELLNQIKEMENKIEELENRISEFYRVKFETNQNTDMDWYRTNIKPLHEQQEELRRQISITNQQAVEVGDGVTIRLYSDAHAYTVIKRTAKTITIQQDKATLDPSFKPEFIPGGFAAHCTNQDEQTYTYERDTTGRILTLHWSEVLGGWKTPYNRKVALGRHEFYDYNF